MWCACVGCHQQRLAEMTKQARAMKKSFGKKDTNKKKEQRREQEMLKRITEEANRKAAAAVAATGYRLPVSPACACRRVLTDVICCYYDALG
jgi:hypothetical protein